MMADKKSRMDHWRETRFLGVLTDIGSFLRFAFRRFINDGMSQAAGALTYSTLLALVPLLVIAFAVLSGFPVFDPVKLRMEEMFLSMLVPETGSEIKAYLTDFTRNASNLTAAGIVALPVTAVLLLSTIETTLNKVWRVDRPRPLMTRILIFWALLTFGPLLLGASFTLSSDVVNTLQAWAQQAAYVPDGALRSNWFNTVLAVLAQSIAFGLLYIVVPVRKVRIREALIGGVFAGLAFQVLRWGFDTFLTSGSTYATIYGAVAVIPIFLIWMYLSWTVIILGAVLAASFPDWWRRRDPLTGLVLSPAQTLEVAVAVLAVLGRQAVDGGTTSQDTLAESIPLLARNTVIDDLREAQYIVETEDENISLSRDLHQVTLADLARDLGLALGRQPDQVERPVLQHIARSTGVLSALLVQLQRAEDDVLGISVAQAIAAPHSEPS